MRDFLFPVEHDGKVGLQTQLRRHLVDAILDGRLSPEQPLPSCRRLATTLGVSRNTVVLAYQALADEGFLLSRERVGYFVNREMLTEQSQPGPAVRPVRAEKRSAIDWRQRLQAYPCEQLQLTKPKDWHKQRYPFIYGQADPRLFPVAAWRLCTRQALGVEAINSWAADRFDEDDPLLVEEVRTRVLPRRGIRATSDEILMTLGSQNALYLVARLIAGPGTRVAIEDPCYLDVRNILEITGATVQPVPVDANGLIIDSQLSGCDCVYVTPSHQSPTTVTMPMERRVALLEEASRSGLLIIEDDYEPEANFVGHPTSALKSMDREDSVIYVGSFSKSLAPGLRIGYLVAPAELIAQARRLRRLIFRHPPANNQRTVALFIAGGYYDSLVHRLQRVYRERWQAMGEALEQFLPDSATMPSFGGTSFWVKGPAGLDSDRLAARALKAGILIEPGRIHFANPEDPCPYFRLGFSSIADEKIEPGIKLLAEVAKGQARAA